MLPPALCYAIHKTKTKQNLTIVPLLLVYNYQRFNCLFMYFIHTVPTVVIVYMIPPVVIPE